MPIPVSPFIHLLVGLLFRKYWMSICQVRVRIFIFFSFSLFLYLFPFLTNFLFPTFHPYSFPFSVPLSRNTMSIKSKLTLINNRVSVLEVTSSLSELVRLSSWQAMWRQSQTRVLIIHTCTHACTHACMYEHLYVTF